MPVLRKDLDISVASSTVWFDVRDIASGCIEARRRSDDWTAGILEVWQSQTPGGGIDTGLRLGPGNDMTDPIDFQFAYVGVRVSSTVEAASETVDIFLHPKA